MKTTETDAVRQLAAQPGPNVMGQDRMRIIERKWVKPTPPSDGKPFEVVITHAWELF